MSALMPEVVEFDCADCGAHVVNFGPVAANDQSICLTCLWLREHPDVPAEVRDRLLQR